MGGRLEGGYCCAEGGCGGAWLVAQGGGGAAPDPALATTDDAACCPLQMMSPFRWHKAVQSRLRVMDTATDVLLDRCYSYKKQTCQDCSAFPPCSLGGARGVKNLANATSACHNCLATSKVLDAVEACRHTCWQHSLLYCGSACCQLLWHMLPPFAT